MDEEEIPDAHPQQPLPEVPAEAEAEEQEAPPLVAVPQHPAPPPAGGASNFKNSIPQPTPHL